MKTNYVKRCKLLLITLCLLGVSLWGQQATNLPEGFVYPSGTMFKISDGNGGGSPYYFSGTNNYYMMYKPMEMNEDVMNDMVYLGQKAVRMWFFMDGAYHDGYSLQPEAGVYDEATMQHMDQIIYSLSQRGLKAVPAFVNYWSDFGGMAQYASWTGGSATDFYSDESMKQLFKDYMAMWANRVNTVTGIAYKDDPTILSWQLTNEARSTSATVDDYVAWVQEMTDYLRTQDPNHMISIGDEGLFNYSYDDVTTINESLTEYQITNDWTYTGGMGDWEATLQMDNVSYGTIHNYATDNWGYTVEWGENWTKYHIHVANSYNKPCVMEEYDKAYSGDWSESADQERAEVLESYQTIIRDYNMAGDMSWMLVGRNFTDEVEDGYTMDNTASADEIWLYRVLWPGDGHQYSRYDPYTGPAITNHCALMNAKSGSTGPVAPIADAGSAQTIIDSDQDGSEAVNLDASGSFDTDGTIVSYAWTEGGTQIATGETATVTLTTGTHNITLTVTDSDGETGSDAIAISVLEGGARTFEAELATISGNTTIEDDETASNNQFVQLGASAASIAFTIDNVPASLTYPVTVVHRSYNATSANGSKNNYITASAGSTIDYVWTASDTWVSEEIDMYLEVGSNTITIDANWGYVEYDYLSVEGIGDGTTIINQVPVANAGSAQTVSDSDENGYETVTLDGSASSDADGTISSYMWVQDGVQIATTATASVDLPVGSNTIQLTVTDNEGATASAYVIITVNSGGTANVAPIANAGSDQTVSDTDDNGLETITLDGSASSDSDGFIVSYLWSTGGTEATETIDLEVGTHTITLTVTDNNGETDTDYVVITISSTSSSISCSSDSHCPDGYVCGGWPDYVCISDGTINDTIDDDDTDGPSKIGIHWTSWDASNYDDYETYIDNMDSWSIDYVSINPTYFIDTWEEGIITTWEGSQKTPTIDTQKGLIKELISRGYYINYRPHVDPIIYGMDEGDTRDNWSTVPGGTDWRGKFDLLDPIDETIGYRETIILPGLQMLAEAIREAGAPVTPIRFDLGAELMDAMLNYPENWTALQTEVRELLATDYSDVAEHIVLGHNFCHHIEYLLRLPNHEEYMIRVEADQVLNTESQYLDREGVTQETRLAIGNYIAGLDETSISQYMPLDLYGEGGLSTTADDVEQALITHEDNFINEILVTELGIDPADVPALHIGEYGMGWRGLVAPNVWDVDAWTNAGSEDLLLSDEDQMAHAAIAIEGIIQYVDNADNDFNSFLLWFGGAPYDLIGINEFSDWYNDAAATSLSNYWNTRAGAPEITLPSITPSDNEAPIANAGSDQTATDTDNNACEDVTLDGSASSDDNGISSYSWTLNGSEIGSTSSLTYCFPVGSSTVTLTVTDADGLTDTDQVTIAIAAGTTGSDNIALNKTATVSSTDGYAGGGAEAVDGDASTRWASEWNEPEWLQVDLGASYDINQVIIYWETAYSSAYQIQVSNDASSWTDIYSTTSSDGGTDDLSISGTGRYIRLYCSARATAWGNSVYELEVYGTLSTGGNTNEAPVANAGSDQTTTDSDDTGCEDVTLDGTDSSDDSEISSYSWTLDGSVIGSTSSLTYCFPVGSSTVTLTVADNEGLYDTDDVVVTVSEVNNGSTLTIYEAENAELYDVDIETDANASNEEYVYLQGSDGSITWTVNIETAGTYSANFGYNIPYSSKTQYLSVNSVDYDNVIFDGTTSEWLNKEVDIDLNAGSNTVTISSYWGYMYFDYLSINTASYKSTLESLSTKENEIQIYPNPAQNILYIKGAQGLEYRIVDIIGTTKLNGADSEIDISDLSEGIYFIYFNNSKPQRFIKE